MMDGDQVVVVICHKTISLDQATKYGEKAHRHFLVGGGHIERSKCKGFGPMVMLD
jgi:hypothetical protein